jgi:hypothetical protein
MLVVYDTYREVEIESTGAAKRPYPFLMFIFNAYARLHKGDVSEARRLLALTQPLSRQIDKMKRGVGRLV